MFPGQFNVVLRGRCLRRMIDISGNPSNQGRASGLMGAKVDMVDGQTEGRGDCSGFARIFAQAKPKNGRWPNRLSLLKRMLCGARALTDFIAR